MITPAEIKKQAQRWYREFLAAAVMGREFFPREIRFGKIPASETLDNFRKIREEIQVLREESKSEKGFGYTVEFIRRKDQRIGEQNFPQRIYFETESDYLRFLGKENEFRKFKEAVGRIIAALPALFDWVAENPLRVIDHLPQWNDLIKVGRYFLDNPRPNVYIREIPVGLHSKFIEENKAILRQILDVLIPADIKQEENVFEKRFNLKYNEPLIRLKVLDKTLALRYFSGLTDLSIPYNEFQCIGMECRRVFILENKTNFSNIFNFLTLPDIQDSISIFGNGFGLGLLKAVTWLQSKDIYYWGDIDAAGFQILSQLRSYLPQTKSLMMDWETFERFPEFRVTGSDGKVMKNLNLTEAENDLFQNLLRRTEDNRLEQERIAHEFAVEKIRRVTGSEL